MKTKNNVILTLILAFMVQLTFAQERTISGIVSDEMGPVADVSVKVKGTAKGTVTDFDGNYAIKAKTGDTLVFTHVSYAAVSKVIGASSKIDVIMKEGGESLEKVVIVGYGITRPKPKSSVAVTTVSAETIASKPNASVMQTLQGQVAGLDIVTASGQPGSSSQANIRGVGSVTGSSEPLYIVDGIVVGADIFGTINSNEIATVSILKDAGATAIYGSRGANGVVVVTTKRGKFDSGVKIGVSSITGFSSLQKDRYNLMNAEEQLFLEKEKGDGLGATMTDAEIIAYARYKNTDWRDVFFRVGRTQDHTVTVSNGSKNISSFTSLGYFQQDGILVDSDLQRFNFRNNLDGKSKNDKFGYRSSVSLNFAKSNVPTNINRGTVNRNYALGSLTSLPHLSPNDYVYGAGTALLSNNANYGILALTPLMLLDRLNTFKSEENILKILASISADYKINNHFTYRSTVNANYSTDTNLETEFPNSFNANYFSENDEVFKGYQEQSSQRTLVLNLVNSLNYSKTFQEKHSLNVSLFSEYFKAHNRFFRYFAQGLNPRVFYPGDGSGLVEDLPGNDYYTDNANADIKNAGTLSFFATADYDFNSKYGFAASVRRDASYRFSTSNRWATFYSVSGRWNIEKEDFMSDTAFDLLKLRTSYGTSGNQRIVNARGVDAYFAGHSLIRDLGSVGNGYDSQPGSFLSQIGNNTLKWETIKQANVGLDFGLYRSKFKGSIDVYKKTTEDLFQSRTYPATSGILLLNANNGSLINKGVELSLFADVIENDNFNLSLSFVGAFNEQARYGANQVFVEEGGKLHQYFTIRYQGVNPENGNLLFLDKDGILTENPTDDDRVFTGKNRFPDYQGSFGFEIDSHGFYFSTRFNYVVGADRYDFDYSGLMDPTNIGNFRSSRDILNAWTPTNRVTNIPSLNATNINFATSSDMYLQSADYLRLRLISFGYTVPKKHISKFGINNLSTFINAENMLTLSGWRGNDVEAATNNAQFGYPTPKIITLGLNIGI